jgi:hypothetical protein
MARPHVEFIPAQVVPWQAGLYGGARPDVEQRVLSMDGDSGESSLMICYPAGWRRDDPEALDVDEEFLVLDGAIEIGGQHYGKLDYAHLPAGYSRDSAHSAGGAVVLTFFSGEPHTQPEPNGAHDEARLVRHIDTRRMAGRAGARSGMFEGIRSVGTNHKPLREDPLNGELTWLVGMPAGWVLDQMETHPVNEEEFAIAGDLAGPRGVMRPGAYFWRPPGIQHGPFGTATGALHLVRSKGGPLTTDLEDKPGPFEWDPAYDPVLPPEYRAYVTGYADREMNY